MSNFLRLYYTIRYLKPIQFIGRAWFRLYQPRPDFRPAPEQRLVKMWTPPVAKPVSLIRPWHLLF